jgi:hypothetical protein
MNVRCTVKATVRVTSGTDIRPQCVGRPCPQRVRLSGSTRTEFEVRCTRGYTADSRTECSDYPMPEYYNTDTQATKLGELMCTSETSMSRCRCSTGIRCKKDARVFCTRRTVHHDRVEFSRSFDFSARGARRGAGSTEKRLFAAGEHETGCAFCRGTKTAVARGFRTFDTERACQGAAFPGHTERHTRTIQVPTLGRCHRRQGEQRGADNCQR